MLVQLIAHTNDPEKTIAAAAKLCYSDAHIETLLDGLTPEKTEAFLQRLNDVGHASPIEHASFTFGIEGVSRTFLAQVTRHRIGSFSVQSQRYVRLEDFRYVIPPEIEAIPEARAQFIASMNDDANKYLDLVQTLENAHTARFMADGLDEKAARAKASKQANEDARFVLPNACETKMVMTMNCRSLQNFFNRAAATAPSGRFAPSRTRCCGWCCRWPRTSLPAPARGASSAPARRAACAAANKRRYAQNTPNSRRRQYKWDSLSFLRGWTAPEKAPRQN